MFGNLGQMMNLMKNAGQIQKAAKEMRERLATTHFEGEAGGGQVRVTVTGAGEIIRVRIEPALVASGDVEMLEDLCAAAFRAATQRSREAIQDEMRALTGGLNIPGMDDFLK